MQETWVWPLIREDPTGLRPAKPVYRQYWACDLEPGSCNCWAHTHHYWSLHALEPVLHHERSRSNEKPTLAAIWEKSMQQQRPSTAKSKQTNKVFKRNQFSMEIRPLCCQSFYRSSMISSKQTTEAKPWGLSPKNMVWSLRPYFSLLTLIVSLEVIKTSYV